MLGRCHVQGKLWPPGRPYGHGPSGPCLVQQVHDLQPQEPGMGQPRPICALVRTFLFSLCQSPACSFSGTRDADWAYSNGHGCMLQYALIHLFGYQVTIDDLKNFRVSSPTAGPGSSMCTPDLPSNSTASHPATQNPTIPPVSRSPPVLSARASPTPSVSPLLRGILPPSSTSPATS